LRRVFDIDALACPACPAGRLRVVAAITDLAAAKKILAHLGLDDEPPAPRSRAPPLEIEPDPIPDPIPAYDA
jgi:hypothetical protein